MDPAREQMIMALMAQRQHDIYGRPMTFQGGAYGVPTAEQEALQPALPISEILHGILGQSSPSFQQHEVHRDPRWKPGHNLSIPIMRMPDTRHGYGWWTGQRLGGLHAVPDTPDKPPTRWTHHGRVLDPNVLAFDELLKHKRFGTP